MAAQFNVLKHTLDQHHSTLGEVGALCKHVDTQTHQNDV